ncbi:MAG: B12-binding domain-containing protein [Candidatus Aminicenantales bacterium]
MSEILQNIASKLYNGDEKNVRALVNEALRQGMSPEEILNKALIVGMDKVGQGFKDGHLFVPEVLMAAQAMQAGLNLLRPFLSKSNKAHVGKYVIGVVKGDLHDIGKNLVKMMMEGAGFEAIDLGANVPPEAFVAAVKEHKPKILGMSALLTTTMPQMKVTIELLKEAGLRSSIKLMVGGAPVTADFAQQIGADGYAPDAATAVDVARQLLALS